MPLVTAYRQEALLVAGYLQRHGPSRPQQVRASLGVKRAGDILSDNVYGWFQRIRRGVYTLSPAGQEALVHYTPVLAQLLPPDAESSDASTATKTAPAP